MTRASVRVCEGLGGGEREGRWRTLRLRMRATLCENLVKIRQSDAIRDVFRVIVVCHPLGRLKTVGY